MYDLVITRLYFPNKGYFLILVSFLPPTPQRWQSSRWPSPKLQQHNTHEQWAERTKEQVRGCRPDQRWGQETGEVWDQRAGTEHTAAGALQDKDQGLERSDHILWAGENRFTVQAISLRYDFQFTTKKNNNTMLVDIKGDASIANHSIYIHTQSMGLKSYFRSNISNRYIQHIHIYIYVYEFMPGLHTNRPLLKYRSTS